MARKKGEMSESGDGAPAVPESTLRGCLDLVTHRQAEGWALDTRYPDCAVPLKFIVDGVVVGRILANRKRDGLKEAGIGNGRNAFLFEFPAELSTTKPHLVQVERAWDGAILANSPMTVEPARR
jgi:hypothetical protein